MPCPNSPHSCKHCISKAMERMNNSVERKALGVTLAVNDTIELSNGITFKYTRNRGKQAQIAVVAPPKVLIFHVKGHINHE